MNINNIGMVDSWREDPFLPSRTGQVWVSPGQTTDYSGTFQQGPTAIAQCPATLYVYANCYWAGGMVGHGAGTYAYAAPSVPYGSSCAYEYRTCSNGTLYGSYGYPSCSVTPGANCTFNGSPVAHTASVTAYQSSIVPFGSSCVSQQRTCTNGTLSGSYTYSSCSVTPPANCTFNGSPVAHTASVTAYQSSIVPFGSSCVSQQRTCTNGTLSGSYTYSSCSVTPPANCTFAGSPVAHGASVTAYEFDVVSAGTSCASVSQTRTCTNGTLSGSYTNPSCVTGCFFDGGPLVHGESVTAYQSPWVVNGASCSSQTRNCTDGTLSGTYAYSSCVAGPPATCALSGFAWSDTAGWLSLNCQDFGTCGTSNYKLSGADDGLIFGHGWSENLGWVSANPSDLTGCPTEPCEARFDHNKVTGWLRVLWGGASQSGGWDGFIRLHDTDYGVTMKDGGALEGFGWGDTGVGWMDFQYAQSSCTPCQSSYTCNGQTIVHNSSQCAITNVTTCASPSFCAPGSATCLVPGAKFNAGDSGLTGHLQVRPLIVATGATAKLYWNVSNVQSCTVSGSNGDHWSGSFSGTSGTSTAPIMGKTTFSLHCVALQGASPATINESATVSVAPTWQEK